MLHLRGLIPENQLAVDLKTMGIENYPPSSSLNLSPAVSSAVVEVYPDIWVDCSHVPIHLPWVCTLRPAQFARRNDPRNFGLKLTTSIDTTFPLLSHPGVAGCPFLVIYSSTGLMGSNQVYKRHALSPMQRKLREYPLVEVASSA